IFGGTIFKSAVGLGSIAPHRTIAYEQLPHFINYLRDKHTRVIASKEANQLICPSWFDGTRRIEDVKAASGIWLDQDCKDGDFSPEEFGSLFPKVYWVAFNTFSSTIDAPKYRLFIPTQTVMTGDEYAMCVKGVLAKIARKKAQHGFDSKPTHP